MPETLFDSTTQHLFADALAAQIAAGAAIDHPDKPDSGDLAAGIIADLRTAAVSIGRKPDAGQTPTVTAHLPGLLEDMPATPLAEALGPFMDGLEWYQIFEGSEIPPSLASGLMAAQLIGGRGALFSRELLFGMFLLAPHVTYPLHQHAALEIYCVLSGAVAIRHGRAKPARHIGPGEHSITPPHQVHELRTGEAPCLITYAWTGDMTGENWWWTQSDDGHWYRQCWQRQADASWATAGSEPLTDAEINRSGDG